MPRGGSPEDVEDYDKIYSYDEGQGFYARAEKDDIWYLLDESGEIIYGSVDYIYPLDTISGTTLVSKNDKLIMISWADQPITEILSIDMMDNYSVVEPQTKLQYNLVEIRNTDTGKILMFNQNGMCSIGEYDEISRLYTYYLPDDDGNVKQIYTVAIGTNNGKKGLILYNNRELIEVTEAIYQDVKYIWDGIILLLGDGEMTGRLCKLIVYDNGDIVLDNLFEKIIH